ncbi:MAG: YbaK/EbsC family protein [Negativicutes bacterium]|nr:YbaK/EbsC family protein [Negativicutes bacterium]
MAIEKVKQYFAQYGMENQIIECAQSSATVALAAAALATAPERIAKTLALRQADACVLIVLAGDAKLDQKKYKDFFHCKAAMLEAAAVERCTGHAIGGVCPFALPAAIPVFLDVSLRRFQTIFPACGSSNSAIELSGEELFFYARAKAWIDVGKGWQTA